MCEIVYFYQSKTSRTLFKHLISEHEALDTAENFVEEVNRQEKKLKFGRFGASRFLPHWLRNTSSIPRGRDSRRVPLPDNDAEKPEFDEKPEFYEKPEFDEKPEFVETPEFYEAPEFDEKLEFEKKPEIDEEPELDEEPEFDKKPEIEKAKPKVQQKLTKYFPPKSAE